MKKYLEIKTHAGMPIRRVEVTGRTEREIDRIERGILINMDADKFFVELIGVVTPDDPPKLEGKSWDMIIGDDMEPVA